MRAPVSLSPAVVVPIAGARWGLAHVSHELRGALTAADLTLVRLERGGAGEGAKMAAAVRVQLERAAVALDELDSARVGAPGRATVAPVEGLAAEKLVRHRVEAWSRIAPEGRTVTLQCAAAPALGGFGARPLIPALDNLIANAIEHGAGAVTVRVSQDPQHVTITVADEGAGIPADLHFRRRRAGRGLGLDIARRATLACGGRLIAEPGQPPRMELPIGVPAS